MSKIDEKTALLDEENDMLFSAKITDDNGDNVDNGQTTQYKIIGFSIFINAEGWMILTLQHQLGSETYYIHTDDREPNLSLIASFILNEIQAAIAGERDFEIEEFLARDYIFVGSEDSEIRQYTAHK